MTLENGIPDKTQAIIIAEMHRGMRHLLTVEGCSVTEILAVMHAEIFSQICCFYGGAVAAECATLAAARVINLPKNPVCSASTSEFSGRMN